ncbi:hypothetical protein FUT87_04005 [Mitsuaria sp. TWR114]|nr:hypothetical protein FUT87_04005 [Mitsuaria sp. TWR114]
MLFEAFLSSTAMESVFSPTAVVQSMMDVEAALARAAARVGLIPAPAAQAIASLCRAELYDVPALVAAAPRSGNLALPVVQRLRETVALFDPSAAVYVHRGASAQDLVDTAMVLRTREALRLIDDDLQQLCARLLELAERHAAVPLLGRTMMQPAQVISLRFKLMNWLMPLLRSAERLREQGQASLLLQLGAPSARWTRWATAPRTCWRPWPPSCRCRCPTCAGTRSATAGCAWAWRWACCAATSASWRRTSR